MNPQSIDWARIDFQTDNIAPNCYTLTGSPGVDPGHPDGAGGRLGVLVGPDGIFIVDGSYAPVTDKVVAANLEIQLRATSLPGQHALASRPHGRQSEYRQAGCVAARA